MTVIYTTTEKTLQPGQSLVFDAVRQSGCSEEVSSTSPSQIALAPNGMFNVTMSGNIGGTTAATPVQLQVTANGIAIPETLAISTPAAVGDLNNVSRSTAVSTSRNRCFSTGSESLAVTNTGTTPVVVGVGFSLKVSRAG